MADWLDAGTTYLKSARRGAFRRLKCRILLHTATANRRRIGIAHRWEIFNIILMVIIDDNLNFASCAAAGAGTPVQGCFREQRAVDCSVEPIFQRPN